MALLPWRSTASTRLAAKASTKEERRAKENRKDGFRGKSNGKTQKGKGKPKGKGKKGKKGKGKHVGVKKKEAKTAIPAEYAANKDIGAMSVPTRPTP